MDLGDQLTGPRQAADRAYHDAEPCRLACCELPEHGFLQDCAHRGEYSGKQAQQHTGHVRRRTLSGTQSDHRNAAERHSAADQKPPGEALFEEDAGKYGDEDGRDVDQHGAGAGVEHVLRGVQRHVIAAEPHHPVCHDRQPLAAARPDLQRRQHHDSKHDGGNRQPSQRQGTGGETGADGADAHESRSP